jgi:hypothetical protein
MLTVRAARPGDGRELAPRLRQADLQEIQAQTREDPVLALERCVAVSDPCHALVREGDLIIALFGVNPQSGADQVGIVWLLGSDELVQHSFTFLRHCRPWVEKLQQRYQVLWNCVDARNEIHMRWLKWCGFTFLRRIEQYGVEKRPFYEFMRRSVRAQPSEKV